MGNTAFADELIEEIYASETAPEDDEPDSGDSGDGEIEPEEMTKP